MGRTPDRRPGPLEEDEEIRLGVNPAGPSILGGITFDGTRFRLRDVDGNYDPRTGGGFAPSQLIMEVSGAVVYDNAGEPVTTT